jgi:hypothetical protein
VEGWSETERIMKRFVAMWVISHLIFLNRYYRIFKSGENIDLRPVEKETFQIDFMKQYRLKYWLKKHLPGLHNLIVLVKKKIA